MTPDSVRATPAMRPTNRRLAVLAVMWLLLAACGGAVQSSEGSAAPSTAAGPSVAESSEGALPSASSESAPSATGLTAWPSGSVEGAPLGYLEYLPPDYGNGETAPLLVWLLEHTNE